MTTYRVRHGSRVYQTADAYVAAEASREGAHVTARTRSR